MSLIYDALRKSEEQRRAGEVPSLSTPVWQPRRRPPTRWPVIAGVAFVAVAVAVFFAFREDEPVRDAETVAAGDPSDATAGDATTGDATVGDAARVTDVNRRPRREPPRTPIEMPLAKGPVAHPSDGGREIVRAMRERRMNAPPPPRAASALVDVPAADMAREQERVFANSPDQLAKSPPTPGGAYVPPEAALPQPLPEPDPEPEAPVPSADPNRWTARQLVEHRRAERAAAAAAAVNPPIGSIPGGISTGPVASSPAPPAPPAAAPSAATAAVFAPGTPAAPVAVPNAASSAPATPATAAAAAAAAASAPVAAAAPNAVAPNAAVAMAPNVAQSQPPVPGAPAVTRAGVPLTPGPAPVPSTSTVPTPPASAPGIDPSLPAVQLVYELPLATRQALPALKLNMHVYNADPARRFVIIDGTRAIEGQPIAQGIDVAEIRPDGIVLRYQSQTFLLPRGGR